MRRSICSECRIGLTQRHAASVVKKPPSSAAPRSSMSSAKTKLMSEHSERRLLALQASQSRSSATTYPAPALVIGGGGASSAGVTSSLASPLPPAAASLGPPASSPLRQLAPSWRCCVPSLAMPRNHNSRSVACFSSLWNWMRARMPRTITSSAVAKLSANPIVMNVVSAEPNLTAPPSCATCLAIFSAASARSSVVPPLTSQPITMISAPITARIGTF
mmetsp:Transcript_33510/g.88234  ORF Transcript_33510/g.88234 Transcript_33510/m.88234 type:complete len:219 (-) Transcript_33510:59-715(-)